MSIDEAGKLYNGYAIIFTNFENANVNSFVEYGIPRIIGETIAECARSELIKKYFDKDVYGYIYYFLGCIDVDLVPNILLPKG